MKPKIIHQLKSAGILSTIEEKPVWKDGTALGCLGAVAIGLLLPVCIAFSARTLREEPYQATGAEYVAAIHAAHPELNDLGPDHVQGAGSPSPAGAALRHPRPPQPAKPPAGGWQPCSITWYGPQYRKPRHHTASGVPYIYSKRTCAVPPSWRRRGIWKVWITATWKGKTTRVWANDICPAGTLDLSDAAWCDLYGKCEDTKLRGGKWRLNK